MAAARRLLAGSRRAHQRRGQQLRLARRSSNARLRLSTVFLGSSGAKFRNFLSQSASGESELVMPRVWFGLMPADAMPADAMPADAMPADAIIDSKICLRAIASRTFESRRP